MSFLWYRSPVYVALSDNQAMLPIRSRTSFASGASPKGQEPCKLYARQSNSAILIILLEFFKNKNEWNDTAHLVIAIMQLYLNKILQSRKQITGAFKATLRDDLSCKQHNQSLKKI
jgi:hypothetical protein